MWTSGLATGNNPKLRRQVEPGEKHRVKTREFQEIDIPE